MEANQTKSGKWFYILAWTYTIVWYAIPMVFFLGNDEIRDRTSWMLLLPIIMIVFNLFFVIWNAKKVERRVLLNCSRIIKFGLIPFYLIGGAIVLLFLLISFIPVPFMIFLGPSVALMLSVCGYLALLGGAPFAIAYISRARKEKIHGDLLTILSGIGQFIFFWDVVAIIVLGIKDHKKKLQNRQNQ